MWLGFCAVEVWNRRSVHDQAVGRVGRGVGEAHRQRRGARGGRAGEVRHRRVADGDVVVLGVGVVAVGVGRGQGHRVGPPRYRCGSGSARWRCWNRRRSRTTRSGCWWSVGERHGQRRTPPSAYRRSSPRRIADGDVAGLGAGVIAAGVGRSQSDGIGTRGSGRYGWDLRGPRRCCPRIVHDHAVGRVGGRVREGHRSTASPRGLGCRRSWSPA